MTLPELCENNENQPTTMPVPQDVDAPTNTSTSTSPDKAVDKVGKALLGVLHQAASQGRATCSLMGCVELLSARPDDVMLCVMPVLPQADAAATIQSTLIKAVCAEHSIRVLMVDCDVKLAKAVCTEDVQCDNSSLDENLNQVLKMKTPSVCSEDAPLLIADCENLAPIMGFPCVLVEFPTDPSADDELVAQFGKEQLYSGHKSETYIELPD